VNTKLIVNEPECVVRRWDRLMPGSVPNEEDVYSLLSDAELRQLACLARIRWLVETGRDAPDGVSAQEAVRIEQAFAERGWDASWLLSQREAVRQYRIRHSFNPTVEGHPAELKGLVLPLNWNVNGRFTRFLLTPELGACSHEPPPPHNQVVYIESPSPITIAPGDVTGNGGELRLSVSGAIHFAASSHSAFLVDGLMRVDASYII
jgi:uncharacterized protein